MVQYRLEQGYVESAGPRRTNCDRLVQALLRFIAADVARSNRVMDAVIECLGHCFQCECKGIVQSVSDFVQCRVEETEWWDNLSQAPWKENLVLGCLDVLVQCADNSAQQTLLLSLAYNGLASASESSLLQASIASQLGNMHTLVDEFVILSLWDDYAAATNKALARLSYCLTQHWDDARQARLLFLVAEQTMGEFTVLRAHTSTDALQLIKSLGNELYRLCHRSSEAARTTRSTPTKRRKAAQKSQNTTATKQIVYLGSLYAFRPSFAKEWTKGMQRTLDLINTERCVS